MTDSLTTGQCAEKVEKHHVDYDKPLLVRWLCRPHHEQLHRECGQ